MSAGAHRRVDLEPDMAELHGRLASAPGGPGRVLQFVSAQPGVGVSTVAREFARFVAAEARRGVWLVELDLFRSEHFDAIDAAPEVFGPLGEGVRASPDDSCFFSVKPRLQGVDGRAWPDARYLDAFPVGDKRWWVTRFRREALKPGQEVRIVDAPAYWAALRAHADWVVVDAPALPRSPAALTLAPQADASVLVVSGDQDVEGARRARDALAAAGGRCAGVVLNKAPAPPPRALTRLIP